MPGSRAEGRERELGRLLLVFEGLPESGLRVALVEGPPGAGERDVVRAFCERARAAGAVVLEGTCSSGRPHAPFEAIVEQATTEVARLGARGAPLHDLACPDGCHSLWFHHHGRVAASRARDATIARRCLHGAVGAVLDTIAAVRPLVVALHGLDDVDPESLELLGHLLENAAASPRAQRLMIVASAREGRAPERVRQSSRTVRIPIEALDRDGLRALLASPELLTRVLASTGGLPAAVERLLASDPPSAEEHLARRIASLGDEARAIVQALAVLDRPATGEELAYVAELTPSYNGAIAELIAVGLVREDARGTRIALADPEDAARVRDRLPAESMRAIAHRCVDVCLREPRDAAEAVRHALRAGLAHDALALWDEAADALHARHADAVGAELLDRIASLAGDAAPVALHARLAELRMASGEFRLALRAARRVLAAAPTDPDAARRVAQALVLAGDLPEAARVVARARARVDPATACELGATLAELLYQSGELDDADATSGEVLGAEPSVEAELSAMQTRAKVALARGALDEAEHRYADYERRARTAGDVRHEGLAIGGRGVVLLTRGALPEAELALRRCARLAEDANDRKGQALAWHNLAVASHLGHDYATARGRYEEALRLLRLVGNKSSLARCAYNLGELYESLGDRARARSMADFGAQVGGTGIAPRAEAEGLLLRGRIELDDGNAERARAAFEAARAILDRTEPIRSAAAIVGLARVALHDGRVDEAARLLEQVPGHVPPARRAEVALTRVALARARGGDTLPSAREAARAADEAGDDILRVESLVELAVARHDRGEHARAAEIATAAAELDARVGERVPDDLVTAWDDRPTRRRLLFLRHADARNGRASTPGPVPHDERLVGSSPAIRRIHAIVARVGPSRCTVLVTGESGTGKELVAEAIHARSPRSDGPLVRVNCAALVESLLVSELFGHEKGAFTGAHERKKGRFELADGGTLFLDEIGDISPAVQAALLRVLSERRFERIGGRGSIEVDVRIVAATNRDLETMVRAGTFREDLYYRLNEVRIETPPLRDRPSDIAALCDHLLGRVAEERGEPRKRASAAALALLGAQRWPGNVRQLENALRVASLFADGDLIEPIHLHGAVAEASASAPGSDRAGVVAETPAPEAAAGGDPYARVRSGELSLRDLKKELERRCIERALAECDGNISKAAGVLGMKRPRLSQLVKEYGLSRRDEQ